MLGSRRTHHALWVGLWVGKTPNGDRWRPSIQGRSARDDSESQEGASLSLSFFLLATELTEHEGSERADCVGVRLPGFLANFRQNGF